MAITGGFGTLIDLVTGRPRRWYMRADGIKRWVSNDQPCDTATEVTMNRLANKLTRTAPRRIWLQCSDDPDGVRNSFGDHDTGEVTWCADSILAAEVEYVRADLVRAAMPINANDPDDPELCTLAELLGMTANTSAETR